MSYYIYKTTDQDVPGAYFRRGNRALERVGDFKLQATDEAAARIEFAERVQALVASGERPGEFVLVHEDDLYEAPDMGRFSMVTSLSAGEASEADGDG